MRIRGEATAYGRAAIELLARQVDEVKAGNPLAPVTVVVASDHAAVAARRALASRPGGVANVTFLTLHRLAERLAGPMMAAAGRRPVSAPVVAAAVRAVLDEAPGVFRPVADHAATERALVAAHRELAAVPDAVLDPVAACSPRAADVVRLHRAVRARLAADWYDEQDLLGAAARALACTQPEGPVIVHLMPELTSAGAELLRMLEPARVNVGVTGDPEADAPVLAGHARAGIDVPPHTVEPGCASRIVSTSDADDEVRAAVRLVTGWAHEGVNLGRVGILYPLAEPYARLVHEQFGAAGIRWNGAPVREVGELLFGRTLRALLALPDRGYRRPDVLEVLTGAPLLDGDRRVPGRAWERLSREAGVVGGHDWEHRLVALAAQLRRQAEAFPVDDEDGWRARRLRHDAETADDLADFVRRLRADLDGGATAGSWSAMVGWATRLIATYLGDEHRRGRWPEEERVAADRVEAALDRLAGLDVLGGPPPAVEVFRRALEGELELAVPRVGRLGDGVLVGHVSVAAGLVLDKVVVLGMAEGIFPPRRLEDSVLPDAERTAAGGELPLRADRSTDDRRHLLAALAAAGEAVLCFPRGDLRRAGERPASRWLVADAARLAGDPDLRSDDLRRHVGEPWLDHVPSFAGALVRVARPASTQELRLAAIARGAPAHPALAGDARLAAALEVVHARRSHEFTRFDGNLAAVAAEIGRPPCASASRLQAWAICPHRYLLRYVLGVEPVEEPGRRLEMAATDKGSLIHEILDEFVAGALASGHPLDRWTPADHAELVLIAEQHFARYEAEGRTGRALFWRRDKARIHADLDRFLQVDSQRLEQGFRPLCTERPFAGVPLRLPSGHVLRVDGMVDRIDRRPDGSLAVLDYKTGKPESYTDLSAARPHGNGTRLQLYLYALAAQEAFPTEAPVYAAYWFNTARANLRQIGYDVTSEVADAVSRTVDTIVEGIAAGVFPAHPAEPSSRAGWVDCWYCTPDGLSGAERRREWDAKRLDPVLRPYLELAEPEVLDDDD